jgi:hypothetical protein
MGPVYWKLNNKLNKNKTRWIRTLAVEEINLTVTCESAKFVVLCKVQLIMTRDYKCIWKENSIKDI